VAAADEREALGRIDADQDLFGEPADPVDPARTGVEEPVEEPDRADGDTAGPDIGEFFAPQPAPAPTIVDRLGRTGVVLAVAFVVVALGATAVGLGWVDRARELVTTSDGELAEDPPPGGWQPAVLLATTVPSEGSSDDLRGLAVVASDRSTGEATVLLIPTATVTDVPGFGSFTLAEAWDFGGSSLVAVTVDNLLGLRIDGVLVKDEASWAAWFDPVGGASIDVSSRIVAADGPHAGSTRFEPGVEFLTPARIAEYVTVRAEGESELQRLPRTQQVLAALSRELASDPDALEPVIDASRTLPGTATPERLRTVLAELADARADDAATTITLPIVPLGTGPDEVYRPDEERLDALMDDRFAISRDVDPSGTRMAVQILNGNARPGIGQDVADALADGRYRIVLTGNADRFTYRETRILIYSDDPDDLAAARDISDRLGVGVIERSGTPQSVVDVTIIVGADFPPDG
jgi:polyisoprenyl-teichoic acid--peptidoglycan teichoic acid transferase